MTFNSKSEDILKRYLNAVSRHLPMKKRTDISRELESTILDMLEEQTGTPDAEISIEVLEPVLRKVGKPAAVAGRYKEEKPLISNELMPFFKMVLQIVLIVTFSVSLLTGIFYMGEMTGMEILQRILEIFSALLQVTGTVFIVFVIIEELVKDKRRLSIDDGDWKLSELPSIRTKVPGKTEIIATIAAAAVFIVLLNLFISKIGIYDLSANPPVFTPVLSPFIYNLLPIFTLRLAAGAVILIPLIAGNSVNRNRSYYYSISTAALEIFDIGMFSVLLYRGPSAMLMMKGFVKAGLSDLVPLVGTLYRGILLLLIILTLISIVRKVITILPSGRI